MSLSDRLLSMSLVLAMSHAFSYAGLPETIDLANQSTTAVLQGGYPMGNAGGSLRVADLNGDNWPDIVVSACGAEPMAGLRVGELAILWGQYPGVYGTIALSGTGVARIFGPANGDPVYCNVGCGDFNNDGFDDILWGHPGSPASWSGRVFMIPGSATFPDVIDLENPPAGVVTISGHVQNGFLGGTVGRCDFNGDSIDDLVLAATGIEHAEVYIVMGSTNFLQSYWTGSNEPGMTRILDVDSFRATGTSMAASDLDDDGKQDLVLGAPGIGLGDSQDGRVTIIHGLTVPNDSLLITDASLRPKLIMPEYPQGQFGQAVAIGDVDNDGFLDLAVSAHQADPLGCLNCGQVYVVHSASEIPDTLWLQATNHSITRLLGAGNYTWYGYRLDFADVDRDHRDDLIVSNRPVLANQRARIVVAYGSALSDLVSLATYPAFTRVIEKKIGDALGSSLASSDLNRDGIDDLLLGARYADPPSVGNGGEIYVVNGCIVPSAVQAPRLHYPIIRAFPNPFADNIKIDVVLDEISGDATLSVFNARGQHVAHIDIPERSGLEFSTYWKGNDDNGDPIPSGVYFCRLVSNGRVTSRKIVRIR